MAEPERPRINELKFTLFTDAPGTEGRKSRLTFCVRDGVPRITVYTNIPDDGGKGMITAAINVETCLAWLKQMEDIAQGPNDVKAGLRCDAPRYENNVKVGQYNAGTLMYGKDPEGIIWISLVAESRPKIKFEVRLSDFHAFIKGDGTELSAAEGSKYQTLALTHALTSIYTDLASGFRPQRDAAAPYGRTQPQAGASGRPTELSFDDVDLPF
jgi:hypothetical protein